MRSNAGLARVIAIVSGLCAAAAGPMRGQSLAYTGAVQYAAGDFGLARHTWSAYLANGLAWNGGRIRWTASLPLVMQDGGLLQYSAGGLVVPGGGMHGQGGMASASGMGGSMMAGTMDSSAMTAGRIGIGDPVARVEIAVTAPGPRRLVLSAVGAIKAPLAGRGSGFGTGEWDSGAGASGVLQLAGMSLFGTVMYWRLGNPAGWSLRNTVVYDVTVGRPLPGGHVSVLGTLSGSSSFWTGMAPPMQLGVAAGYQFDSRTSLIVSLAGGLSRSAPALTTAIGWRVPVGSSP